jgi:hypothetical protein
MKQFINMAAVALIVGISLGLKPSPAESQTTQQSPEVVITPKMRESVKMFLKYKNALDSLRKAPVQDSATIIKLKEGVELTVMAASYYAQLDNKPKGKKVIHFDPKTTIFVW